MSLTTNVTGRLVIDDFKAGIFSDYHASAPAPAPTSAFDPKINGAAVVEDTWGCCADRSGALVPLPRVTTGKTSAPWPSTTRGTALPGNYLLDAIVVDEVQQGGFALSQNPEVVTMNAAVCSPDSTWHEYMIVRRWHEFKDTPNTSDVSFAKAPAPLGTATDEILSGNLSHFRGVDATASLTDPRSIRKGFTWVAHVLRGSAMFTFPQFVTGAITAADQALTDYDEKYAVNFSGNYPNRVRNALLGYFPNFASTAGIFMNSGAHYDGSANDNYWGAFMCAAHQGRLVVAQRINSQYENRDGGLYAWKDRISSTDLLQPQVPGGSGEFVEENTSGIGTMASLSADEMLVIKHVGGGMLLRGSINTPTVVKLPFMESTAGIVSSPVATPLGLVYGSRNGVFVWDGGETSKHLSPQLDGYFWRHSTAKYQGHQARFGYWHPWVMAPNGFMFDSRHNSWWRLDDPTTHAAYNVYATSANGRLFAFPWRVAGAENIVWNTADPDTATSAWSWKSQPLIETRDKAFKARDLTILATSTDVDSTITVTIVGFDERGASVATPAQQFTLANNFDRPQMLMADLPGQVASMSYMQVRIQASTPGGGKAPKLHSLSIGVLDTNPIPKVA